MIDKIIAKPALNAQVAVIYHCVKWRGDFVYKIIFNVQAQVAPDSAKWTGGRGDPVGFNHGFLRGEIRQVCNLFVIGGGVQGG